MEINPKLWGSLGLPLSCGVDFVGSVISVARGETPPVSDYTEGKAFRYISLDLGRCQLWRDFYLFIRDCFNLKMKSNLSGFPIKLKCREILRGLRLLRRNFRK